MKWKEFLSTVDNRTISNCLNEVTLKEREILLIAFPTENQEDMCYEEKYFSNSTLELNIKNQERFVVRPDSPAGEYREAFTTFKTHLASLRKKFEVSSSDGLFWKLKAEFTKQLGSINLENLWQNLYNLAEPTNVKMGVKIVEKISIANSYRGVEIVYDLTEDSYPDIIYIHDKFKINIHLSTKGSLILLHRDSSSCIQKLIPSEKYAELKTNLQNTLHTFPDTEKALISSRTSGRNEIWAAVIPETAFNYQKNTVLFSSITNSFNASNKEQALRDIFNYIKDIRNEGSTIEVLRTSYSVI